MDNNAETAAKLAIDDAAFRFSHALRVVKATRWGEELSLAEAIQAATAITLSADLEAAAAALGEIADGGVFADDEDNEDNPLA
jgi:hypothetical protein